MKKRSLTDGRLSSCMNARFDVVAPKKELENAGKEIERARKEAQKTFEREKHQLQKKLDTLPNLRRVSSLDPGGRGKHMPGTSDSRASFSGASVDPLARFQKTMSTDLPSTGGSRSSFLVTDSFQSPDDGIPQVTQVDKQADALRQLKFLYDCAAQLVAGAETANKTPPGKPRGQMDGDDTDERRASLSSETSRKTSKQTSRRVSYFVTTGSDVQQSGSGSPVGYISKSASVDNPNADFQGPPSLPVQLMSMVRVLAMNQPMDSKEVKALTAVIEETRSAVKSVKSGMEPERAQEKLVKKLNELLDLVKPKGTDLIISPEELLRCSYLRLSKENVSRLEEMIREKGYEPGIHSHTDVRSYMDKVDAGLEDNTSTGMTMPMGETTTIQPVSIFMTKAGAPMDKSRTSRPDSVPGPSTEEEMARLKKFRAT